MVPDIGDICWVELDPIRGTEQSGRRPALFMTDKKFHRIAKRAIILPITRRDRPWAFHQALPDGLEVHGFVMVDQIRVIDIAQRTSGYIDRLNQSDLLVYQKLLATLLHIR